MHRLLRLLTAFLIPVLAFLVLASWSLSSSVGSSPDDDFHLAAIWCGLGDREGLCENPGDPVERLVPTPVADVACYAFDAGASGACWNPDEGGMARVDRANIDGLYPRLFYAVMAPFASTDVQASVMSMRLFNSAIAVGLLTAVFFALPRRLRPVLLVSVLTTVVPLGMFVLASTNPSSWAYLSAATLWISLYGATITTGRRRLVLAGLAILAAVIGAGARGDAAVYAVFAVALVALLTFRRRSLDVVPAIAAGTIVVIAALSYFTSRQGGAIVTGLNHDTPPLTLGQQFQNFVEIPSLWLGALGGNGLGWLDTPLPSGVYVMTLAAFAGAFFVGIHGSSRRRIIAVIIALAAMWLVPFILLSQSHAVIGTQVQARYILPIMVVAVGVASLHPRALQRWRGWRAALAATCLSIAAALALHTNIRRYTTGLDVLTADPGAQAEWWWPSAPSPLVTWIIGSLAFAAMAVLLVRSLRIPAPGGVDSSALSVGGGPSVDTPAPRHAAPDATASTGPAAGESAVPGVV